MMRLVCLLLLLSLPAQAEEEIILGLSQNEIDITATFTGSEILLFGAIRRDAPVPISLAGSRQRFRSGQPLLDGDRPQLFLPLCQAHQPAGGWRCALPCRERG